jgi:hypothetical protein
LILSLEEEEAIIEVDEEEDDEGRAGIVGGEEVEAETSIEEGEKKVGCNFRVGSSLLPLE